VVVRDRDRAINAFVNVCRHRGTQVASGCGHRETLQCPYHAWTYDLDGSLRAAPRSEREPGFDKAEWGLFPVKTDTWGPFVFVNPDVDAPPLADFLGELPATVEASGLDLWSLRFHRRTEFEIRANWKIVVENYLECYHCPVAHPSFSDLIDVDPDAYRLEAYEWYSSQLGPVRSRALAAHGEGLPYDPSGEITLSQFHYVWPNFTLNVIPGAPNMAPLVFAPLDEERTLAIAESYFTEGIDEKVASDMMAFGNEVGREDQGLVESVHRGLKSGTVPQGRLLLASEHLIQHFQRLVFDALAVPD
jgi:choline monooxygenase